MPEVQVQFGYPGLQITYSVAEAIVGGQLVERRAGSRLVGVAGAASVKVAGVARWDVPATRTTIQQAQVGDGDELDVARGGVLKVTFAAAANEGDKLIAAAAGQVTPAGSSADPRTIVGEAFEAVASGAVGRAYIY